MKTAKQIFQDSEDLARAKMMALMPTTISDCHKTFEQREADAKIQINAARFGKQAAQDASEAYALARQRGIDSVTPAETSSVFVALPVQTAATPAPVVNPKAKRRTWRDVSSPYIVEVIQAGQYATCKELYRALEAKAGPNSPFDKGTGDNRGSLFVREIAQSLNLKTVQNEWQTLRELAQK